MFDMLKRAFKWHWNLLGLGAGVAFAVLSGRPDVVLPVVVAGELAYLGFLGMNDRFQRVLKVEELDGEMQRRAKEAPFTAQARKLQDLLGFLSPVDVERFNSLRQRCSELTQLQKRMKGENNAMLDMSSLRTESLDKLLWLFLKLLHHKSGTDRFLSTTDLDRISKQLDETEREVDAARTAGRPERLIASLEEGRDTLKQRVENYTQTLENRELVLAELNKTEQKIRHICEVGMTTTDATGLSVQIDTITSSISASESAISDLRIGDLLDDEVTPTLIEDMSESPDISFVEERESA
jgi:hypothetical protein